MATKEAVVSRVEDGQQALVVVLLVKSPDGTPMSDGIENDVRGAAKQVLTSAGMEVAAQSQVIDFDAAATGEIAKLTASLETVVPGARDVAG